MSSKTPQEEQIQVKPIRSLFWVNDKLIVDLEQIVYIRKDGWVSFKNKDKSMELYSDSLERLIEAWVAYKGTFDPKRDR